MADRGGEKILSVGMDTDLPNWEGVESWVFKKNSCMQSASYDKGALIRKRWGGGAIMRSWLRRISPVMIKKTKRKE